MNKASEGNTNPHFQHDVKLTYDIHAHGTNAHDKYPIIATKSKNIITYETTHKPDSRIYALTKFTEISLHHTAMVSFPRHAKFAEDEYQYDGSVPSHNWPCCSTLHIDYKYAKSGYCVGKILLQNYYSTPDKNGKCIKNNNDNKQRIEAPKHSYNCFQTMTTTIPDNIPLQGPKSTSKHFHG